MGFSYSEVEEAGLIDAEVLENIPSACDGEYGCGSELEFTENLTQIYCPDRYCTYKIAARLEAMAKDMKADGWGPENCLKVVKYFHLKSPAQVFLIPNLREEVLDGASKIVPAFNKKLESICDAEKRRVQLWQVVKYMNIPGIAMNALKIFGGYTTMEDAYADIEKYQISFIMEKLGIAVGTSVMAINVYETLLEYKDELLAAQHRFEIFKPEGDKLKIAITGGVEGYSNKSEFVNYLNKISNSRYNISLMNTVSTSIDILVADNDTSSRKYMTAKKINGKLGEEKIKILDGKGCIDYLKKKYKLE